MRNKASFAELAKARKIVVTISNECVRAGARSRKSNACNNATLGVQWGYFGEVRIRFQKRECVVNLERVSIIAPGNKLRHHYARRNYASEMLAAWAAPGEQLMEVLSRPAQF